MSAKSAMAANGGKNFSAICKESLKKSTFDFTSDKPLIPVTLPDYLCYKTSSPTVSELLSKKTKIE